MLRLTCNRLRIGAAALPLLVLLAIAAPASAVTIGQTGTDSLGGCASGVYADTTYVVPPGGGTITSFSIQTEAADAAPGNSVNFKLLRPTGGNNYLVVGESGVKTVVGTGLETFAVNIPAQAGDILGMFVAGIKCHRLGGSVIRELTATDPPPATTVTINGTSGSTLNESANLVPTPAPADYATIVLGDNPAGYWRFGETPGSTTLVDSSGNANNGTYLGGVTLGVPGALVNDTNTAARFDGVDDIGRVPDSASLDVGSSFTLQGWVKRTSDAKTVSLFNKGNNGLHLVVTSAASGGGQVFLRKTNVSTIARSSGAVPADGQYHHIVATLNGNGSTAKIYVDGADVTAVVSPVQTVQNTALPLVFGSGASVQADFDEFALYDGVLTSAQVLEHYNAGRGL